MSTPKSILGWWFSKSDGLPYNDGRRIVVGETLHVDGEIMPCERGLHLSEHLIDALQYAPGPILWRVEGSGTVVPHGNPVDKYACSDRKALWMIDATPVLRRFARACALDVIHQWAAPDIVIRYLATGDESIRAAARDVAWAAARDVAWAAAWAAARAAAMAAVDAAMDAAWAAACTAAWAARKRHGKILTEMIEQYRAGTLDLDAPLPIPNKEASE